MEVSEESIKFNNPLPPLPNIDLREKRVHEQSVNTSVVNTSINGTNQNISVFQDQSQWAITDEDNKKYTELFNKNKDLDSKISLMKAFEMFKKSRIAQEKLSKILNFVPPIDNKAYSLNEFKVIIHLIYKCFSNVDVPDSLPDFLQKTIFDTSVVNNQSLDFMNILKPNSSTNISSNKQAENLIINSSLQNPITMNRVESTSNTMSNFPTSNISVNGNNNNYSPSKESLFPEIKNPVNSNTYSNVSLIPQNMNSFQNQSNSNNFSNQINPTIQSNIVNSNKSLSFDNLRNIQTSLPNVLQESQNENNFLTKVLEEDQNLLDNITEDLIKVMNNIERINEKNSILKTKILDIRRKINLERDNLLKANMTFQTKSNELISNTNEFLQINEESNKFSIQNQQFNNINSISNLEKSQQIQKNTVNTGFTDKSQLSQNHNSYNNEKTSSVIDKSQALQNQNPNIQTTSNQNPYIQSTSNQNLYNNNNQVLKNDITLFGDKQQTSMNQIPINSHPVLNNEKPQTQMNLENFPQTISKFGNEFNKSVNINSFNSIDKNNNMQINKSPGNSNNYQNKISIEPMSHIQKEIKFDDKNQKNDNFNNMNSFKAIPDNLTSSKNNDFGFNFSMDNKPEIKNFDPPKNFFENANKSPQNDFGLYPEFEKKEQTKGNSDAFNDDFGNFGNDFNNFDSDFKKAQKDKDFFNDNWGGF